jgi:LTXXQ motif family protein
MKKKALIIGAMATAAVLAGGWALAQSAGHGPGGFGPPFMHGPGGMGPGMMQHMGQGMGPGMGMMQHMGGGMGPGMMHGGTGPMQFDPARLETLKAELGITAAQEPAWGKYAKTLEDAAAAMKTTREGINPDTVGKMTPQDRFAFATKIREQAQKQFATVKTAAEELLATLDDTQKAKARQTLPGLAFGPGMRHAGGTGGPQH